MNDHVEQVVIHKDPKFQFAEGTPAEILNQMPREIVNSLAEASFNNLTNAEVYSFVSKGNVIKLDEEATKEGNYRVSFRSSLPTGVASSSEIHPERVKVMEISPKDYTDQRIDALEKSIDHRFDSTEKLLSEKMDHLFSRLEGTINNQNTKLDGKIGLIESAINSQTINVEGKIKLLKSELNSSTDTKLNEFKTELVRAQKSARNTIIGWTIGLGAIITAIGIAVVQGLLN